MKILKPGKRNPKMRKFTCPYCDCEFACKSSECNVVTNGLVTIKFPVCPCCHKELFTVWKKGEEYKERD